jgi:hypothetical protein
MPGAVRVGSNERPSGGSLPAAARRRKLPARLPALSLLVLIAVLGVLIVDLVKRRVVGAAYFRVNPEQVEVGELPAFVPEHVAEEIRALTNVGSRSIFDGALVEDLRGAVSSHPWVSEVASVHRVLPNRVALDLRLREPFAVVEVGAWRLAVDDEGVVLEDHPSRIPAGLPRIRGDKKAIPRIPRVGHAFRCQPVTDGLSVAEDLAKNAEHTAFRYLQVALIDVSGVGSARLSEIVLELTNGTIVDWGSARCGTLGPIELPASRKLDNLLTVHDRNPGLQGVARVNAATKDPFVTLKSQ